MGVRVRVDSTAGGSRGQAALVPGLPRVLCGPRGISESWGGDGGRAQDRAARRPEEPGTCRDPSSPLCGKEEAKERAGTAGLVVPPGWGGGGGKAGSLVPGSVVP